MIDADMLEHANRHDAVERAGDIAIVLQLEACVLAEAFFGRALIGDRMLLFRQRDAGDVGAANFGEIKPKPAPAAADVEHAQIMSIFVRPEPQLGGQMPLLGELGIVERLIGLLEIGAAVLPVGVEE